MSFILIALAIYVVFKLWSDEEVIAGILIALAGLGAFGAAMALFDFILLPLWRWL